MRRRPQMPDERSGNVHSAASGEQQQHCRLAMRVLIWPHAAVLDSLHGCRCRRAPLRRLRLCVGRLLLLDGRQEVVRGRRRSGLLLSELTGHLSIHVWVSRISTTKGGPGRSQFAAKPLVLCLGYMVVLCFWSQPCVFVTSLLVRTLESSYVLNRCHVSAWE
jgi:hypothetical protein